MKKFAWSYSALTRYENCPKQYYHINLKKDVKDEYGDSEAGAEGNAIHQAMFARVTKGDPLPFGFRPYERWAAKFASTEGEKHGELKLAINRDFQPTSFFADDVYARAIVDLLVIKPGRKRAVIADWKTGKVRPDYTQLALMAAMVSIYEPTIEVFDTAYVWLKHNNLTMERYTRNELLAVWGSLIPRVDKLEAAVKTTEFPAKPSGLCRFCPVSSCPNFVAKE